MFQRRILTALLNAATLLTAAAVLGPIEADAAAACRAEAATNASVLAAGAKVADWQLSHLDNFDYVPDTVFRRETEAPRDWIQAAFYIGLTQFADVARQPRFNDAVLAHGEAERWGFGQRLRHADAD